MSDFTHGWHLRKEVTIGQIFTTIALVVTGLWWAASIENRQSLTQAEIRRIEEKQDMTARAMNDRFDRYQRSVADALNKIESGIQRISDKLDRKADK